LSHYHGSYYLHQCLIQLSLLYLKTAAWLALPRLLHWLRVSVLDCSWQSYCSRPLRHDLLVQAMSSPSGKVIGISMRFTHWGIRRCWMPSRERNGVSSLEMKRRFSFVAGCAKNAIAIWCNLQEKAIWMTNCTSCGWTFFIWPYMKVWPQMVLYDRENGIHFTRSTCIFQLETGWRCTKQHFTGAIKCFWWPLNTKTS